MEELLTHRKRRKVGTRSCQLCRQRKQRCELPDTEIEDSSIPLGPDKACHRCTILQVDCVVDDRGALKYAPARRLKRKQEANGSPLSSNDPSPQAMGRTKTVDPGPSNQEDNVEDADLMRTFEPYQERSKGLSGPTTHEQRAGQGGLENGLKYHGRPLSITTVMVQIAQHRGTDDDLLSQVSPEVLGRFETLYPQLLIFHPYLPNWSDLISSAHNELAARLRLYLVIYLLSPYLPHAMTQYMDLNKTALEIVRLRDHLLRSLPQSKATLHSLLILNQLAPLGAMPRMAIAEMADLSRQRGILMASRQLIDAAPLQANPRSNHSLYTLVSTWEELQLWSQSLADSIEEDPPRTPPKQADLSEWGQTLFNDPSLIQYAQEERLSDERYYTARVIGKLEILERAVRLEIVRAGVSKIQDLYPEADLLQTISDRLAQAINELEQVDDRLSFVIAALGIDISEGVAESWMSYRNVCYQYHLGKLYRTAIRTYIATAFLPSQTYGQLRPYASSGDDPTATDPHILACDPRNVHLFFTADPAPPARQYILPVLVARVEGIAPLLQNFLALQPRNFIPWHQVTCMAVDTCNVIMEVQAGTLAFGNVNEPGVSKNFRLQEWAQLKKMLVTIASHIRTADAPVDGTVSGGRTLGGVASKLIHAMVRVMGTRIHRFALDRARRKDGNSEETEERSTATADVPEQPLPALTETPPVNVNSNTPSDTSGELSAADLDLMFAEIFNTTYQGAEFLTFDGDA